MSEPRRATGPRVALLTTIDFWWPRAGNRTALLALVSELVRHVDLTLVMPLTPSAADAARLAQVMPGLRVRSLGLPAAGDRRQALAAFAAFFRAEPQEACIVEYLSLAWMRAAVPPGVLTLLDSHDVSSQYDAGLAAIGALGGRPAVSEDEERRQLATFDHVMAISRPDAEVFTRWLGAERVLRVPPGRRAEPLPLPLDGPPRLLFVGSRAAPNVDGLAWFLAEVWPRLDDVGAELHVVGGIGPVPGLAGRNQAPRVTVHGAVLELQPHYAAAHLCINPVRHGSGLKIKSVEALAYGRPLVATRHAARGLEADAGRALLVTDDAEGFAQAVRSVLADRAHAQRLADEAIALVRREFSAPQCYAPLLRVLGVPVEEG